MRIIGITGGTGAGKSTVCEELKNNGATIVDCDRIAHSVVEKGKPALAEIVAFFGNDILSADGNLDRKKMSGIVFSDKEKLVTLNKITHKYIFEEMLKEISEACTEMVVLDVPLLFQCDFPFECDLTVAVVADKEERIYRIMRRDGISREAAQKRMSNQLTDDEYRSKADFYFVNDGDPEKIKEFVKKICSV